MKSWKRAATILAVGLSALAVMSVTSPADAGHRYRYDDKVVVMSQNLYIGADLERLLPSPDGTAGEPPAAVLATALETNFPARAVEIARGIDDFKPDLIGLQEVSLIMTSDAAGNQGEGDIHLDYLQILMNELADRGAGYAVASVVVNSSVTLPLDATFTSFGTVVDRDVILYRTATTSVADPQSGHYDVNFTVPFAEGVTVEFTRGWVSVEAEVRGEDYRFVNTHLEVAGAPCLTATGPVVCQDAQADQLVDLLADGGDDTTLLVGDFNAEPGTPAYETIVDAGYLDTWTVRPWWNDEPGDTCCQSETLDNPENQLDKRIDHLFVSVAGLRGVRSNPTVVFDWEERKTPSGLWPTDHGGPWAELWLDDGSSGWWGY